MGHAMSQVFKFVSENPRYRPSLGVITSVIHSSTFVTWGAICEDNDKHFVPHLDELIPNWPDARWTQLSKEQASLFDKAYERERDAREDFLLLI
jgi:hypothetical protein